jgi:hypothetical protein
MALVACGECGKSVSTLAASCPNCGAPVTTTPVAATESAVATPASAAPKKASTLLAVAFGVLVLVGLLVHESSSTAPSPEENTTPAAVDPPAPTVVDSPASAAATVPEPVAPVVTHNWSYHDDGESQYGYEQALSEDDRRAGKAVEPMVMVRYVGQIDGQYRLEVIEGPSNKTIITCKDNCEVVKTTSSFNGYLGRSETLRVAPSSIISAVLQDMFAGQLDPVIKPQKSAPVAPTPVDAPAQSEAVTL